MKKNRTTAIFITNQGTGEEATDVVVDRNLCTDPATVAHGTDANTGITTYDTRDCTISGNVVGKAYPNITYDSAGLSTGLTVTGNVRGETLPP
jgi:hypothetical protein